MKLSNNDIGNLYKWLAGPMHGEELRARTKFINLIEPIHNTVQDKRVELLEAYADQDKDKKAIIENGMYKINPENQVSYIKEFDAYLKKDSGVKMTKQEFRPIYEILRKSTKDMDVEQGKEYDKVMSAFEALK